MKTKPQQRPSAAHKRPCRVEGDIAFVDLGKGREAIIDAADADIVGRYNWSLSSGTYAYRQLSTAGGLRQRTLTLHRFLMDPPPNMVVDHINGDSLDNRRMNLRICTRFENFQNRAEARNLGMPGVRRVGNGYVARLHLGPFPTAEEAQKALMDAARAVQGESSPTLALARGLGLLSC